MFPGGEQEVRPTPAPTGPTTTDDAFENFLVVGPAAGCSDEMGEIDDACVAGIEERARSLYATIPAEARTLAINLLYNGIAWTVNGTPNDYAARAQAFACTGPDCRGYIQTAESGIDAISWESYAARIPTMIPRIESGEEEIDYPLPPSLNEFLDGAVSGIEDEEERALARESLVPFVQDVFNDVAEDMDPADRLNPDIMNDVGRQIIEDLQDAMRARGIDPDNPDLNELSRLLAGSYADLVRRNDDGTYTINVRSLPNTAINGIENITPEAVQGIRDLFIQARDRILAEHPETQEYLNDPETSLEDRNSYLDDHIDDVLAPALQSAARRELEGASPADYARILRGLRVSGVDYDSTGEGRDMDVTQVNGITFERTEEAAEEEEAEEEEEAPSHFAGEANAEVGAGWNTAAQAGESLWLNARLGYGSLDRTFLALLDVEFIQATSAGALGLNEAISMQLLNMPEADAFFRTIAARFVYNGQVHDFIGEAGLVGRERAPQLTALHSTRNPHLGDRPASPVSTDILGANLSYQYTHASHWGFQAAVSLGTLYHLTVSNPIDPDWGFVFSGTLRGGYEEENHLSVPFGVNAAYSTTDEEQRTSVTPFAAVEYTFGGNAIAAALDWTGLWTDGDFSHILRVAAGYTRSLREIVDLGLTATYVHSDLRSGYELTPVADGGCQGENFGNECRTWSIQWPGETVGFAVFANFTLWDKRISLGLRGWVDINIDNPERRVDGGVLGILGLNLSNLTLD